MLFQRINRTDPEKVFVVAKNSYSTASLTNGQVVNWDYTTDADGVGVTKPADTTGFAVAGLAAETIAHNSYGLIQVYGYHSAGRVDGSSGLGAGSALGTFSASFALIHFSTGSDAVLKFPSAFCMEAYSTGASAAKKVFIKAL
ncbi:MAG: hypothetical protein ACFFCW_26185 [Candidatus Hodarchaeota archaeon]